MRPTATDTPPTRVRSSATAAFVAVRTALGSCRNPRFVSSVADAVVTGSMPIPLVKAGLPSGLRRRRREDDPALG